MRGRFWVLACAVMMASGMATGSDAIDVVGLEVGISNDVVADQDQNLSNAFEARVFFTTENEAVNKAAQVLALSKSKPSMAVVLAHDIYTPEDRISPTPIPQDRPYAGRFAVGVEMFGEHGFLDTRTRMDIGVVGPGAGGEQVQDAWHRMLGNDRFNGWDNQLEHRLAWSVMHQQAVSLWRSDGQRVEVRPHWGAQVGNWQRRAHVGATLNMRLTGEGDVRGMGEALTGGQRARGLAAWVGVQHDHVFSDNSLREGRNGAGALVEPRRGVGTAQIGLRYDTQEFSVAVARAWSEKQFDQQSENPSWGSITAAWYF